MSALPGYRVLSALALVAVAAVAAAALVLATRDGGGPAEEPGAQAAPVVATGTLTPRIVLFGDTLTAQVDVVADGRQVDADSIRVGWSHAPWTRAEPPRRQVRRSGDATLVRTTFVLRCHAVPCVPVRETEEVDLEPARVTYTSAEGGSARLAVQVPWPTLVVHTRIGELDSTQDDALSAPWRADLVSLPAVSYRIAPGLVVAALVLLGSLLVLGSAVLAYRLLPERVPPPEPEPEPEPVAPPLEQALALLESPVAVDGAQDRRRALELCADEVEAIGDGELAQAARALAWSEDAPGGERTRAFAARLRASLERGNGVAL